MTGRAIRRGRHQTQWASDAVGGRCKPSERRRVIGLYRFEVGFSGWPIGLLTGLSAGLSAGQSLGAQGYSR